MITGGQPATEITDPQLDSNVARAVQPFLHGAMTLLHGFIKPPYNLTRLALGAAFDTTRDTDINGNGPRKITSFFAQPKPGAAPSAAAPATAVAAVDVLTEPDVRDAVGPSNEDDESARGLQTVLQNVHGSNAAVSPSSRADPAPTGADPACDGQDSDVPQGSTAQQAPAWPANGAHDAEESAARPAAAAAHAKSEASAMMAPSASGSGDNQSDLPVSMDHQRIQIAPPVAAQNHSQVSRAGLTIPHQAEDTGQGDAEAQAPQPTARAVHLLSEATPTHGQTGRRLDAEKQASSAAPDLTQLRASQEMGPQRLTPQTALTPSGSSKPTRCSVSAELLRLQSLFAEGSGMRSQGFGSGGSKVDGKGSSQEARDAAFAARLQQEECSRGHARSATSTQASPPPPPPPSPPSPSIFQDEPAFSNVCLN